MKKSILLIALTLMIGACASSIPDNGVRLKIDGMTCQPCADTLMKKFSKEVSLASANVDWKSGNATLIQKDGQRISDVEIGKIVDWSGFDLISIDRAGQ